MQQITLARAGFKKAGSVLNEAGEIVINPLDSRRWEQVSHSVRVAYELSPWANSFESIHGHLNESTPRRNDFWVPCVEYLNTRGMWLNTGTLR
jgi:hypothetical protein